jgi:hypothetical protein
MSEEKKDNSPSWYRARITAIRKLMEELPTSRDEKNSDRTLIRNGLIPESQQKRFDEILDYEYKLTFSLNEPLTFTEITSFNTWFVMHPEKICGKETITTSREFPVTVKGTKDDIIKAIKGEKSQVKQEEQHTHQQFQTDTKDIEPEPESNTNRFGDASRVLEWTVQDFHSYYHNEAYTFIQQQEPVETKIAELQEKIREKKGDRNAKKELTEQLNEAISQRNFNKNAFEGEWIDFCLALREIIIAKAKEKSIDVDDENNVYLPDDILLAVTDRPGIEVYWNTRISDVIEKELQYFVKENKEKHKGAELLELEALALETELQLLNI